MVYKFSVNSICDTDDVVCGSTMAELLSVQIHAPSMWTGPTTGISTPGTANPGSAAATPVLKKVDNRTVQATRTSVGGPGTTLKHLTKRRPVDLEFRDLTYSVSEGRKRGKCFFKNLVEREREILIL